MNKYISTLPSVLVLLLCVLLGKEGWSQNLVPNPSFEEHKAIPCGFISVLPRIEADSIMLRPDNLNNYLENWYTPTSGTADYWFFSDTTERYKNGKDCANGASFEQDIPSQARTGYGYLGLYVSYQGVSSNYREYAQVKLLKPLKKDFFYHVSFFAKLSNSSAECSNRVSILLSYLPIIRPPLIDKSRFGEPLIYSPQVETSKFICQPAEWVEISTCIQATGGEEYLTIGNFFNDETTPIKASSGIGTAPSSYYLIDDVTVEEVGDKNYLPPANFLGKDTTLCSDQQMTLVIPFKTGSIRWIGGDTSRTLTVDQTGAYRVEITKGKCIISDTVQINVVLKLAPLADTILCRGDATQFTISPGVGQIRWENGSTDSVRLIDKEGTYWITTKFNQCIQMDSLNVKIIDCPGLIPNVITPNNDGKNDTFYIKNIEITPWELTIYNRWGSKIYYTEQYQNEWNALNDPSGVYYYFLKEKRSKKNFRGWVEVFR